MHGCAPDQVVATGAPVYDQWFARAPSTTRDEFCAKTGLRADRPFFLYLCSSQFIAPDESEFVAEWVAAVRSAPDPRVRDAGILSLEDAHWRLSGLPAWAAGFNDRGLLREGMLADLMIYDLASLAAQPVQVLHDLPAGEWRRVQRAIGYRWIMVRGEVTFDDGRCTGAVPGRLVRAGR